MIARSTMMALASSMGMLAIMSSCAFADDIEVGADGGFVDGEDELYGEDELEAEDEDVPAAEVSAEEAFDIDNRPWLSVEKRIELPDSMYVVIPAKRPNKVSYEITNIGVSKAFRIELNDTFSPDSFQVTPVGVPYSQCDGGKEGFDPVEADGSTIHVFCNGSLKITWPALEPRALSTASVEITPLADGWMEPQRAEVWYDVKEEASAGGEDTAVLAHSSSGGRVRVMTSDEMVRATGKLWPYWGVIVAAIALVIGAAFSQHSRAQAELDLRLGRQQAQEEAEKAGSRRKQ